MSPKLSGPRANQPAEAFLLVFVAALTAAQTDTGALTGVVSDSTGALIPALRRIRRSVGLSGSTCSVA